MSACGAADRTARWALSEPPRWTIRRTTAILAASLLLVVVAGVPAWAGASFTEPEVEADSEQELRLRVTEPEDEQYDDTVRVVVTAPAGFTIRDCESPTLGGCTVAEDGNRVTFTRTVALGDTHDLQFTVHTSPFNGQHAFRVTQADGPPAEEGEEPPATVSSAPEVTVIGGTDPEPEPTTPADDGGSQDSGGTGDSDTAGDGGSQDGGGTDDDATQPDSDSGTTTEGSPSSGDDGQETAPGDSGSTGGSTAPRRTQGRSSGTTLEITPGEPTDDDPAIAPPAVADDPAVAPPSGADRDRGDSAESTAAAAVGAQPSDQPDGGTPWQQWVGAAMLLAGLATVGVRWFRERRSG